MFIKKISFQAYISLIVFAHASNVAALETNNNPKRDIHQLSDPSKVQTKKQKLNPIIIQDAIDPLKYHILDYDFLGNQRQKKSAPKLELVVVDEKLFEVSNEAGDRIRMGAEDKNGNIWSATRNRNIAADINAFNPEDLHALNSQIAEFRHNLYQNFHRVFVQAAGGRFKCTSVRLNDEGEYIKIEQPEGIYTKFAHVRDIEKSQAEFLNDLDIHRLDLLECIQKAGELLIQIEPHVKLGAFAKTLYNRRIREFDAASLVYAQDGSETLSFNEFLNQLEATDLFLENTRQVFQGILSIETLDVSRAKKETKAFPIHMKSGL